jgi:hypothetical protein
VPQLEAAGLHFVEDLAEMRDLTGLSAKAGLTPEKLDELKHAAQVYLERERAGDEVPPSSTDAGPEEGYAPSELLEHLRQVEAETEAAV